MYHYAAIHFVVSVHACMNIVGFKFRASHERPPSDLNAIWLAGDHQSASHMAYFYFEFNMGSSKVKPSLERSKQAAANRQRFCANRRHLWVWHMKVQ
jgi:hypothetical protein